MGKLVPVQEKLDEIEEQGQKLRRRQEYLKGERDFLIDAMITITDSTVYFTQICDVILDGFDK